jgi:hypothetical protein
MQLQGFYYTVTEKKNHMFRIWPRSIILLTVLTVRLSPKVKVLVFGSQQS